MTSTCEIDFESACDIDLTVVGLDRYSRHPSCRVLMAAYAIDGGDWIHWQAHLAPFPEDLRDALMDSRVEKHAYNAQFERVMTRRVLGIPTPVRGWRCTQVLASLQSFPGTLGEVGERIGLATEKQKLTIGKRLIKMFCQPQKITANQPYLWRDWKTDPDLWAIFGDYNVQDCVAERAIRRRLAPYPVPDFEWQLYELDQAINDRGNPVDVTFVANAISMVARRKSELTSALGAVTGLKNPGSPVQLTAWLRERGYPYGDIQKGNVVKALALPETDPQVIEALKLRQWQARTSVAKYNAIMQREVGGRVRYLLQMGGAARTNRWAGRTVQNQNLPGTPDFLEDHGTLLAVTGLIRAGDIEGLSLFTSEPMDCLVGCLRSSFQAPEGWQFVVADLASIESGVVAWLAGCEPMLKVFRDGLDPYKTFAVEFFHVPYDGVPRAQRKFCKPVILGGSYRLGGGEVIDGEKTGLWAYAEAMGVEMTRDEAHRSVKVFRATYPEIPVFWKALEYGVERTIRTKRPTQVGHLTFEYRKPYVMMRLPSGRHVYYYESRLVQRTIKTGRMITKWIDGVEVEEEDTYSKLSFTYMGQSQKTRQWGRIDSHGGRTTEQATQATAREVLAYGMMAAHKAGYNLVSHVHDELIALQRIGDNRHTLSGLIDCMTAPLAWAPGLPLGAAGYVSGVYRKD
jgi:DNA polymerase